MTFQRKYGAAATIQGVPLLEAGTRNFKAAPTLAAGDVKISQDGGAFADLATLPTVTPAGGKTVKVELAAAELECKVAVVQFVDQTSPKEWDDQEIIIETFGHASAQRKPDLGDDVHLGVAALGALANKQAVDQVNRTRKFYKDDGTTVWREFDITSNEDGSVITETPQ